MKGRIKLILGKVHHDKDDIFPTFEVIWLGSPRDYQGNSSNPTYDMVFLLDFSIGDERLSAHLFRHHGVFSELFSVFLPRSTAPSVSLVPLPTLPNHALCLYLHGNRCGHWALFGSVFPTRLPVHEHSEEPGSLLHLTSYVYGPLHQHSKVPGNTIHREVNHISHYENNWTTSSKSIRV